MCIISITSLALCALRIRQVRCRVWYVHIRRRLRVARSSLPGNAKASSGGMGNDAILHVFFVWSPHHIINADAWRVNRHKINKVMLKANFGLQLPDGNLISYKEILSPFNIYRILGVNDDRFVLIPKEDQTGLQNTIFLADENGVRKYKRNNDDLQSVNFSEIPQYVLTKVCPKLVDIINYNSCDLNNK